MLIEFYKYLYFNGRKVVLEVDLHVKCVLLPYLNYLLLLGFQKFLQFQSILDQTSLFCGSCVSVIT